LIRHYLNILSKITDHLDGKISQLKLFTDQEKQMFLTWNETGAAYPEQPIHQLIDAQVRQTPEAPAVRFEGQSLNYRELNKRTNQIAHCLIQRGVEKGDTVGVYLERSLDLLPALLAVMKAGGAYLPMDPIIPTARLDVMLDEADAKWVLTQESLLGTLPEVGYRTVSLDGEALMLEQQPGHDPEVAVDLDDIAYTIFTSGSTGKPKGVEVTHRGLTNFMVSMQREPGMSDGDVLASVTTIIFDIAVLELFLPLISGAQVVVIPTMSAIDGKALGEILEREGVTVMQGTPATWRLLVQAGWRGKAGLKMLCGGETLSVDLARELLERGTELWNLYGPTETTVWSTCEQVQNPERITIGRPIANTRVYILDKNHEAVPVGVTGKLFIGGLGLAKGYVKQPELTAEKFIVDPSADIGERVYDTGDLARWLPDGRIEHLGRQDSQVKIRGFRIELEDIAANLRSHPAVEKSVVTTVDETALSKRLIAYLVLKKEMVVDAKQVRSYLVERLPEYMLPSQFVFLDWIPLKPNGKVDYSSLPVPKQVPYSSKGDLLAPRNQLERELAHIWEEVLEISPIGIQDNFFDLGGHSLLAIRLLSRIKENLGLELPVMMIFQSPTIEKLADAIRTNVEINIYPHAIPIIKENDNYPFFCVHGFGGGIVDYIWLARLIEPTQSFYGLEAKGINGLDEPHETIEEIAAFAINCMKVVQPSGPYFLGGYCYGGVIAYEMTRQIEAMGEEVALLAIFEGYAPIRSRFLQNFKIGALITFISNLPFWFSDFMHLDFAHRSDRIQRVLRNLKKSLLNRGTFTTGINLEDFLDNSDNIPEIRRKVMETQLKASFIYEPKPIKTKITLFRGRRLSLRRSFDPKMGWGDLTREGVDIKMIDGSHLEVIVEPQVHSLARQLSKSIAAAKFEFKI
jgi:amino acid adenylation domain-containing protein